MTAPRNGRKRPQTRYKFARDGRVVVDKRADKAAQREAAITANRLTNAAKMRAVHEAALRAEAVTTS